MVDTSDADIVGFLDKLAAFRESLTPAEQHIFDEMLTAALTPAEVEGFDKNDPNIQRQALMATVITNLANMRHEMLKSVAQNLRG